MTLGQLKRLIEHHEAEGMPSDAHVNISVYDANDDTRELMLMEARPVITFERLGDALYLTAVALS